MGETMFHTVYGSPLLQAMVGLKASDAHVRERPGEDAAYRALVIRRIDESRDAIAKSGPREALLRALIYVRMPDGVADERGFNFMRSVREEAGKGLSLAEFKKSFRDQFLMLVLDERRAVETIPDLLAKDPDLASRMADNFHRIIDVVGLRTSRRSPAWKRSTISSRQGRNARHQDPPIGSPASRQPFERSENVHPRGHSITELSVKRTMIGAP